MTSPEAVLLGKMAYHTKQIRRQCMYCQANSSKFNQSLNLPGCQLAAKEAQTVHAVGSNSLETTYILFELPQIEARRVLCIGEKKPRYVESRYLPMSRVTFQTIGDWDLGHCISACSWQIILCTLLRLEYISTVEPGPKITKSQINLLLKPSVVLAFEP